MIKKSTNIDKSVYQFFLFPIQLSDFIGCYRILSIIDYRFYRLPKTNTLIHRAGIGLGDETGEQYVKRSRTGTSANLALPVHLMAAKS